MSSNLSYYYLLVGKIRDVELIYDAICFKLKNVAFKTIYTNRLCTSHGHGLALALEFNILRSPT